MVFYFFYDIVPYISGNRNVLQLKTLRKKGNAKECSNYCTTALISHASKGMLKILQARVQQHEN